MTFLGKPNMTAASVFDSDLNADLPRIVFGRYEKSTRNSYFAHENIELAAANSRFKLFKNLGEVLHVF